MGSTAQPENLIEIDHVEAQRMVREKAIQVLESIDAADLWLLERNETLAAAPSDLLGSDEGRNRVMRALIAIEYGLPP